MLTKKPVPNAQKCWGGVPPPNTFGLRWASTSIMYHAPKIVHDEVYTTTIRATVTDRRTDVSRSSQFLSRPPVVVHFLYHASCIMHHASCLEVLAGSVLSWSFSYNSLRRDSQLVVTNGRRSRNCTTRNTQKQARQGMKSDDKDTYKRKLCALQNTILKPIVFQGYMLLKSITT
jgi:hypothetical protein